MWFGFGFVLSLAIWWFVLCYFECLSRVYLLFWLCPVFSVLLDISFDFCWFVFVKELSFKAMCKWCFWILLMIEYWFVINSFSVICLIYLSLLRYEWVMSCDFAFVCGIVIIFFVLVLGGFVRLFGFDFVFSPATCWFVLYSFSVSVESVYYFVFVLCFVFVFSLLGVLLLLEIF